MNRRPILKISVFAGAASLLTALGLGGMAWARGGGRFGCHGGNRAEFMKKMASMKIDDALDYAKVDDGQRQKIHDIRDRVFAELEKNRPNRQEKMAQLKELFLADRVDDRKLAALKDEHQQKAQAMADVFEKAFIDAHDVLTADQRAKIVEYAEKQRGRWAKHESWQKGVDD